MNAKTIGICITGAVGIMALVILSVIAKRMYDKRKEAIDKFKDEMENSLKTEMEAAQAEFVANSIVEEMADVSAESTETVYATYTDNDKIIINCTSYIIPNKTGQIKEMYTQTQLAAMMEFWLGVKPVNVEDIAVPMCTYTEGVKASNWQRHHPEDNILQIYGLQDEKLEPYMCQFPGFFPSSLLLNVKENDVIEFKPTEKVIVRMKFQQLGQPNCKFVGTFEEAFDKVVN